MVAAQPRETNSRRAAPAISPLVSAACATRRSDSYFRLPVSAVNGLPPSPFGTYIGYMLRKLGVASTWTFSRIAGLAGLGFAILIASTNAFLVPAGLPHTGAETNDVVQFFTTRQDTVGLASALAPIAWVLATLFGAGAVAVVWRSEQGTAWSLVGFAGVIMQNITFTGVMATRLALASTTAQDSSTIAGLWALHNALFVFNGTFLALAMTGLSISGRRAGLIRRWHSGIGLLAAALQFGSAVLSPLAIDDPGTVGLLGLVGWLIWVVWVVAYGITLIRPTSVPTRRAVASAGGSHPGSSRAAADPRVRESRLVASDE
ncbi:hypothetical protein [Micromonospora sp. WMMD1155]|uniref:hypothetical protein n=1 Tax=Micromonospora sp. WMMD1155 TaxID=3016094 RepID=UPI00249A840C|nr:hypothetical protein [Micromonospora sp. WMMD1155]WFE53255.1 hypothetical protein O7617_24370 [Micromonospora sp. WMMD1155]